MNGIFIAHILEVEPVVTLDMGMSVYQVFYMMETEDLTHSLRSANRVRFRASYNSEKTATGSGAVRQFASRCFKELVADKHLLTNGLTVYLNPGSDFWDSDENLRHFVDLIAVIKANDGLLPYHLSPIMLSMFYQEDCEMQKRLQLDEASVEFFLKHNNGTLLECINRDKRLSATLEEMGCKSKLEYMIMSLDDYVEANTFRYVKIGDTMPLVRDELSNIKNLIEFDEYLSGSFEITAEKILEITVVTCENYDTDIETLNTENELMVQLHWKLFVTSLTEKEIRCMLKSWTADTKIDKPISIEIVFDQDEDINIQTCFRKVKIPCRIFFHLERLNSLRTTFVDDEEEMAD